ncbi:MAG: GWxTD domain-containing protein, partial [Bacteroidota bacterium]
MRLAASFFVLFAVLVGSSADQSHAQHDATSSDLSVAADPLGSIRAALRDGEVSVAARLARERLAANRRDIEARVLLAQALIALEEPDYPAALAEVDRVVLRHDEHVDAQHTRLRILRAHKPRSWPPAEWRFAKQDLARKVLRLDPDNHTAHVELGVQAAQEAERFHNGVKLGRGMYATPANFGTRFDETAARSVEILDDTQREDFLWQFDLDLLESQGIAIVSYEGRAESAQAEAERYLGAALRIDGSDLEPVRLLLANRLVRDQHSPSDSLLTLLASQRPEDPTPWWIRGHLLYNGRDLAGASAAFEEALHRTDTTSQRLLRSPALVVADEASARMLSDSAYAEATWAALDPRRLSSLNERRLEHYARVAFADVVYGGPNYGGRRGWETEPGRTYIRYGPPNETVQFIPDLSGDGV